ncbi:MAG: hypothetical protein N2C12_05730, partial [Planctomycetales bacterium]
AAKGFQALSGPGTPTPSVKHMSIISDGDPTPSTAGAIKALTQQKVKVTTVAVGTHGRPGSTELRNIAKQTGGKYYVVSNAKALPKIYQREVRRLAKPLIFERDTPFQPVIQGGHEIVKGIQQPPPITGFVLTSKKDSPLVEVSIVSPEPKDPRNNTILATWTYGLGKTVALTTDTGETSQGWAKQWKEWEDYKKLFSKVVLWSMRPVEQAGDYLVATDIVDGKAKVIINAWDKDEEYLNFLTRTGTVVGPDLEPRQINIQQVASGRYIGEFDAQDAGGYMININPGRGGAPIRAGLNIPYSAEYRDREANLTLLEEIVKLTPAGGKPGVMIEDEMFAIGSDELALKHNSFRHDLVNATSRQDIWPMLLLLAGCLFFGDVFFRRVHVGFAWLAPVVATARDWLLRREAAPVENATMARLKSRKEEVVGHIEQRRAAARFDPVMDDLPEDVVDTGADDGAGPRIRKSTGDIAPESKQEEGDRYTSRLLKAKKDALRDRGNK